MTSIVTTLRKERRSLYVLHYVSFGLLIFSSFFLHRATAFAYASWTITATLLWISFYPNFAKEPAVEDDELSEMLAKMDKHYRRHYLFGSIILTSIVGLLGFLVYIL